MPWQAGAFARAGWEEDVLPSQQEIAPGVGFVNGPFGISRTGWRAWTLTHLPTGLHVFGAPNRAACQSFANTLLNIAKRDGFTWQSGLFGKRMPKDGPEYQAVQEAILS